MSDFVLVPENPLPPGGKAGWLTAADGARLRYAAWPADASRFAKPRGTVVLLHGRGEFIEKYFEVVGELIDRGFAVATFDWRGQGLSDRPLADRRKCHIDDFSTFDSDLELLMAQVVAAEMPLPWVALAHSMGGNVLIRAAHDKPDWFGALVVSTPMLGLKLGGKWAQRGLRLFVSTMCRMGRGAAYVPAGGPAGHDDVDFADNVVTSDPERYARTQAIERANRDLALGSPTMGWLDAAFRSIDRVGERSFLAAIRAPALMFQAGRDSLIEPSALGDAAQCLPAAELVTIGPARHEIMMERAELRRRFWSAFDRFADRQLGPVSG